MNSRLTRARLAGQSTRGSLGWRPVKLVDRRARKHVVHPVRRVCDGRPCPGSPGRRRFARRAASMPSRRWAILRSTRDPDYNGGFARLSEQLLAPRRREPPSGTRGRACVVIYTRGCARLSAA